METCLFRRLVQWNLMNFEYCSITENFTQVFTLVNVVKIIFCQVELPNGHIPIMSHRLIDTFHERKL